MSEEASKKLDEVANLESARAKLDRREESSLHQSSKLRALMIYELLRTEGDYELTRPVLSLCVAGIAAGITLGFSVLGMALFLAYLEPGQTRDLIAPLGYTLGFIIVILAKMQLFTENTITAIVPFWARPSWNVVRAIARLWAIVFFANMFGAFLFAVFVSLDGILAQPVLAAFADLSQSIGGKPFWKVVGQGVMAGFLIAVLVWVMPNSRGFEVLMIIIITYVIALAGFAHVVAGGVEAWFAWMNGLLSWWDAFGGYVLPAFIGNVIGGTALFTTLAFAQVTSELVRSDDTKD